MDIKLEKKDKEYYLYIARKSIADKLNIKYEKNEFTGYKGKVDNEKYGVFVTLTKNGNLRGCIGYVIGVEPLIKAIRTMAVEAAFKDPRFYPLRESEFNLIKIEISILSPMEKVKSFDEIEIGKHGLMIKKGFYSGLLLPQVATEYNMDRKTFLEHVSLKAGLNKDAYKDDDSEILKFSAYIFSEG